MATLSKHTLKKECTDQRLVAALLHYFDAGIDFFYVLWEFEEEVLSPEC